MCNYAKLTLNIDTSKDVIGRVVCNKESQWEAYTGMPSDFITEVFHAPAEEAILYVFRSYVNHENDAEFPGPSHNLRTHYDHCHLLIVLVNSDHPLISVERHSHPNKKSVEACLNDMLEEINTIERKRLAGNDAM